MNDLAKWDSSFPPELVAEVAILAETSGTLELTSEDLICGKFNITKDRLAEIRAMPVFQSAVANTVKELRESHGIVRMKSALAFEATLDDMFPMWLSDPDWSPLAKVKLVELLAEYGGIKNSAAKVDDARQSGPAAPTITINLSGLKMAETLTTIDVSQ